MKFRRVVFETHERTDRQTNKHTDTLIAIFRTPTGAKLKNTCQQLEYVDVNCFVVVYCEQYRFAVMPAAQKSVGISSSVAFFLLIVSICCVLSISSYPDGRSLYRPITKNISNHDQKRLEIDNPDYVPNIALICVMLTGFIAMVVFVCKKGTLTDSTEGCHLTTRNDLHRKYSFRGIAILFIGVCTLYMNYLRVEFSCRSNWFHCSGYFLDNVVVTIFHIVSIVFAIFELVICWTMQNMKFKSPQLVWHLVAFLMAANITVWFNSLLKESYDRNEDHDPSLNAYFSFCYNITFENESYPFSCSDTSSIARWFLLSAPILSSIHNRI